MAAHVKVLDTTLKTTTVKVTPGTYMTDVLEEACKKFGRDATNFTLKHKEKPLNLSLPFRQTGLISGAKLELIATSRSPTPVTVGLQLPEPDGKGETKLVIKASSDKTLWKVLRQFEDEKERKLHLTDRPVQRLEDGAGQSGAGRLFYEEPVLNIMGRQIAGLTELQKTLAQFGITDGTVSIRISFRPTNIPFEEATANIEQFFDEPSDAPAESSTTQPSSVAQVSDSSPALSDVTNGIEKMATPSNGLDDAPNAQTPAAFAPKPLSPAKRPRPEPEADVDDGKPLVYRPPSGDTPRAAQIPHDEKAYEHSISQVKSHQALLNKASTNKKLLSDAEEKRLEEEKAAKLSSVKEVNVKVRMPDQFTLQFSKIGANDTCLELYRRVINAIIATDQQFKLVYSGETGRPETIPKDDKKLLIKHLGFRGNVLVNFHWLDGVPVKVRQGPILKSELTEKARDINVPMVDAPEVEDEESLDNGKGKEKAPEKAGSEEKRKKMMGNLMQRFSKK